MAMRGLERGYVGPFAGVDVPWLVDLRARTRRDHPFLIWEPFEGPGETLSYGAFRHRVGRLAAGLARRGLKPGDFLLVHLDNCLETILAWYAAAMLGAVAVTTNTRSSAEELSYFAEHCGAAAAITQPAYAELVNAACRHIQWLAVTAHDAGAPPPAGRGPDRASAFDRLLAEEEHFPRRAPEPMAPVGVQYTSGTTARPKGVVWTHANALWGAKVNAAHEDLRPEDVHLVYLPLFHTNAQAYSVLATLWAGGSGSDPAALLREPVLERRGEAPLQLDLDHPVLHPRAARARVAGAAQLPPLGQRRVVAAERCGLRRQDHRLVGHDRDHDAWHRRRGEPAQPTALDRPRRHGIRDTHPRRGWRAGGAWRDWRSPDPRHPRRLALQGVSQQSRAPPPRATTRRASSAPATASACSRTASSNSPTAARTCSRSAARTSRPRRSSWRS